MELYKRKSINSKSNIDSNSPASTSSLTATNMSAEKPSILESHKRENTITNNNWIKFEDKINI